MVIFYSYVTVHQRVNPLVKNHFSILLHGHNWRRNGLFSSPAWWIRGKFHRCGRDLKPTIRRANWGWKKPETQQNSSPLENKTTPHLDFSCFGAYWTQKGTDPFLQNIGNFGWFSGFLRFVIFQFSKQFVVSHIFEKSAKSFLMSYTKWYDTVRKSINGIIKYYKLTHDLAFLLATPFSTRFSLKGWGTADSIDVFPLTRRYDAKRRRRCLI